MRCLTIQSQANSHGLTSLPTHDAWMDSADSDRGCWEERGRGQVINHSRCQHYEHTGMYPSTVLSGSPHLVSPPLSLRPRSLPGSRRWVKLLPSLSSLETRSRGSCTPRLECNPRLFKTSPSRRPSCLPLPESRPQEVQTAAENSNTHRHTPLRIFAAS